MTTATTVSLDEFNRLIAQGYNRIPLARCVMSDFDTPLGVFLKLANQPYTYLFESVQGGERWGRYSIVGLSCCERLQVNGQRIEHFKGNDCVEVQTVNDPLAYIEQYQMQFNVPKLDGLPRFNGGLVGYMGYETIRYIEPKLGQQPSKDDPLDVPDVIMMLSDELVVLDNLSNQVYVIVHAQAGEYDAAQSRLDELVRQLRQPLPALPKHTPLALNESGFDSGYGESAFKSDVDKIKQYIRNGDCMQVVLSQRLTAPFSASALDLYRSLRSLNPSPYMYYLDMGDFQVVGSSPEILVRLEDDVVTVRPIAGTRKRGQTPEKDRALEKELLNDPKEIAEHLMLIDLGRNDAGRVSEVGTVKLTDSMFIERYSHVMHIVSNVEGKLKSNLTGMDVIRATFPAGTVSGAPKIRAMEIIDELEPVKRGVYSGAIGYMGWHGNVDTAIAIRTAVVKNNTLYVQAGAGVVYDSQPELEWQETLNKSRALFSAAAKAEAGLDE